MGGVEKYLASLPNLSCFIFTERKFLFTYFNDMNTLYISSGGEDGHLCTCRLRTKC